ncbi:tetratricopeptide repeat protein [Dactylosporangium sp. AC04546]|uniref:tetratricopeptide repeat protein n=1 Tax=Dactylosporangium sp. AC04546 TaxID=2862460 RepID=UPI001EDD0E8B|nr:tetratricopeptide repeat protein [Dactylosporangium sp. AC04546]WVK85122.1 tetratricopeptide repeat protein [Dactylosporangium sp. AC04546]
MSDPRQSQSIFTRGAVDLGALARSNAAAAQRAAQPAQAPAASGANVVEVNEATFQNDVLQRSLTTPVVVDFYVAGSQPDQQFSPLLQKLAAEGQGTWLLARVDIEQSPRLAQMFRIQGIPFVVAIVGGQPVDAFNQMLPEQHLRQWIDAVLKAAGVEVEHPDDPRLLAADDALIEGDLDGAEAAYRKILADTPGDPIAEAGLAQVGLMRRITGVDVPAAMAAAQAQPDDVPAQLLAADIEVVSGEAEQAYQRLVNLIRRTAGDDRETVRQHLVSLFTVAGPDDPAVAKARRALASALF